MSLFSYILGVIPLIQNLPISPSTRLVYTSIGMVFKFIPFLINSTYPLYP